MCCTPKEADYCLRTNALKGQMFGSDVIRLHLDSVEGRCTFMLPPSHLKVAIVVFVKESNRTKEPER